MKTWFVIADIFTLVLLIFMLDNCYTQMEQRNEEYNEIRLSRSVEYAAEAAFTNSISQQDAALSYMTSQTSDAYNVPVSTRDTLETFETILAYNYGFAIGDEALATIEDSIGVIMLAGTDGYYVTDRAQVSDSEEKLHWTVKLPYSYEITKDKTYITYGLTLNTEAFTRVAITGSGSVEDYSVKTGDSFDSTGGEMTDAIRKRAVSGILTDALEYYMAKNLGEDPEVSVYIPSTQTLSGINSIASPTLIVIMDDCSFAGVSNPGATALSGQRIIKKVRVIGYKDGGELLYSYEYQGAMDVVSSTDVQYFDTIEEAAAAGYAPDGRFLFNKISYDREEQTSADTTLTPDTYAQYDVTKSYKVGDYVTYKGRTYACTKATSGTWSASCWMEITE